jgi:hypothetical protein
MLKWVAAHEISHKTLQKANQTTLRGLALRGLVSRGGITPLGMQELSAYGRAEFIQRQAQNKDLSDGVMAALRLIRVRKAANG